MIKNIKQLIINRNKLIKINFMSNLDIYCVTDKEIPFLPALAVLPLLCV